MIAVIYCTEGRWLQTTPPLLSIIKWFGGKDIGSESVFEVFHILDECHMYKGGTRVSWKYFSIQLTMEVSKWNSIPSVESADVVS